MSSCLCPTAAPMSCTRSAEAWLCTPRRPHPSSPHTFPCRSPHRIPTCCTPHRCRPARSSLAHKLHRSALPGPSRQCSIDTPPQRHPLGRVLHYTALCKCPRTRSRIPEEAVRASELPRHRNRYLQSSQSQDPLRSRQTCRPSSIPSSSQARCGCPHGSSRPLPPP